MLQQARISGLKYHLGYENADELGLSVVIDAREGRTNPYKTPLQNQLELPLLSAITTAAAAGFLRSQYCCLCRLRRDRNRLPARRHGR
jgi:hypothetical protein